ncbi:TPA: N-acetylmuramoyl-L-alanine amidase [Candidatus Avigastranaerophilus faecigallinarum]|nr:N-acetylmuramoyl-L-alanine amidase [Candidatus Avigastranaerophilus faecigallinarum]
MKIFINPGHGGSDPGAISKSGVKEAVIAAEISSKLNNILINSGYKTELFQQKNSVLEVTRKECTSNSDLFISIHCNSHVNPSANGVEVLYFPSSIKGKKYAEIMQQALVNITKLKNRGIIPRNNLYVLKATKAPAILIELAFLSNSKEELLLKNNQDLFINALFTGIEQIKSQQG